MVDATVQSIKIIKTMKLGRKRVWESSKRPMSRVTKRKKSNQWLLVSLSQMIQLTKIGFKLSTICCCQILLSYFILQLRYSFIILINLKFLKTKNFIFICQSTQCSSNIVLHTTRASCGDFNSIYRDGCMDGWMTQN